MSEKMTKKIPCEVYSRIVGYLRPIRNWNKGKQQEFQDRKTYQSQVIPVVDMDTSHPGG